MPGIEEILRDNLTPAQAAAALDPAQEVLALACAGSGKSRTLAFHRRSMWIVSAPGVKSRSGHRRASKFAGPHALMHGHVEIRGKGRWRQLVSQGDKVRDVGLGWRLHVRAPATLLEPQAGKLSRADRRPGAWPR